MQSSTFFDATITHHGEFLDKSGLDTADMLVYAAALSTAATCEEHPKTSYLVNYETPSRLAKAAIAAGVQSVFLSSNAAAEYDGMLESEARLANGKRCRGASTYGLHKFLAEREIVGVGGLVIRMGKVAPSAWPLIPSWISALSSGHSISVFNDDYISPIHTETLSKVLVSALRHRLSGLVEISASDQVTYFDIAKYLLKRLGKSSDLVSSISASTIKDPRLIWQHPLLNKMRASELLECAPPTSLEVVERSFFDRDSLT